MLDQMAWVAFVMLATFTLALWEGREYEKEVRGWDKHFWG